MTKKSSKFDKFRAANHSIQAELFIGSLKNSLWIPYKKEHVKQNRGF